MSAREDSLDSRPGTCRLAWRSNKNPLKKAWFDAFSKTAYTQPTPSLSLNNPREYHRKYQSSVPLSPVLPSSLSLSLSLNPGLRFRFSDVSFLRFRMEGNTRAAVIGESTPFSNPRIRHESVVFVSLFPPRLLFHVCLLLLSRPRASVPSQVSLFHDFLVSDFSLSPRFLSSLYSLDLSRSYRCGLYLCTLSLSLCFSLRLSSQFNGNGGSVTVPLQGLSVYQTIRDSI